MEVSSRMDAWLVRLYRLVLAKRGCWEAIWNIDIRDAAAAAHADASWRFSGLLAEFSCWVF